MRLTCCGLACLLSVGMSCRAQLDVVDHGNRTDAGSVAMPWGTYAATLDVPACPTDAVLLVNTTDDELEGGRRDLADPRQAGDRLSFTEALWIAWNRPGRDTILFDAEVFPVAEPATITMGSQAGPNNVGPVCIDGRNRGVVIDWKPGLQTLSWRLESGSLQVGLTLLHMPFELEIFEAQIAGCRLATDGYRVSETGRFWTVNLSGGARFGPGNVISGNRAIRAFPGVAAVEIAGNDIGFDPLTGVRVPASVGIDIEMGPKAVIVANNVFLTIGGAIETAPFSATFANVHDNFFGTDRGGSVLWAGPGIGTFNKGDFVIGPGNVVRGQAAAIALGAGARAHITRNVISGNDAGILFQGAASVVPPQLSYTSDTEVRGTCSEAGDVELFADPGDQGERFLGATACDGASPWAISVSGPRTGNLTATLTTPDGGTSAFSTPLRR